MALVFCLSQCKKNDVKPVANNTIQITLNAAYSGEKTVFNDGTFTWNDGDTEYIYVGCEGESGCIGTLSTTGNGENELVFSGTLTTTPEIDAKVYFFYLGNGEHADATTLDFSNQTSGNVTDFHIAVGSATYTGSTDFYATLQPIMAIAKLDLSSFGSENIYVYGDEIYASATIDYSAGTITKETKGYINIGVGSATKYVALIPSTESQTTVKFASNSHDGSKIFGTGIRAARFYALGNNGALVIPATTVSIDDDGIVPGLFSVANTDGIITKMVRFSKGNLQYVGSNCTWQFAEHQYDYLGTTTSQNSTTTTVTRDLFGWGTTGYQDTRTSSTGYQTYYEPYSTSSNTLSDSHPAYNINKYGYGPDYDSSNKYGLAVTNKSDWGMHPITNGGNTVGKWRTLTIDEFVYVFNTRSTTSGVRYAMAAVNGISGLIILPDDWSTSYYILSSTNTESAAFTSNTITLSDWNTKLEANGAVFLPAAGYRGGTWVYVEGSFGFYWSSSCVNSDKGYVIVFYYDGCYIPTSENRSNGFSVRLVRPVE